VSAASPQSPTGWAFEERRIAGSDGTELAVRLPVPASAGGATTGPPMVLVHGLSSNARLWDGVALRLAARGHPVAAVDQRGHGLSAKPETGYDWETLTADLLAVLAALGWSSAVVAGQSWGGNVVVELAARHPQAVVAAVLVDGGTIELQDRFADWPTCLAALTPPQFDGVNAEQFEALLRRHHPDWPEEGIQGTLGNAEVLADGTVRPWLPRPVHLQIIRLMWEQHPSLLWPTIEVPVVIVPAEDATAPTGRFMTAKREEADRALRGLRHGSVHWLVGDHDLHAQHPDQVAAILHDAGAAKEPA
jgi:pimeloyl-ACP methyl ester carboxylesterase